MAERSGELLLDRDVRPLRREDRTRLVDAVTDDASDDGGFERRRMFQCDAEQFGELGEVSDAGEDIDQQHFDVALPDPAQHLDEPCGISAQKPGADVAEVERLAATRRHLVDQHRRQSGAGGEQADLAFRIDLDVIEAIAQLAYRVGIDLGGGLDQPGNLGLALRGVKVDYELGVASDAAVRANEQRLISARINSRSRNRRASLSPISSSAGSAVSSRSDATMAVCSGSQRRLLCSDNPLSSTLTPPSRISVTRTP